ncbi:MAG: DUF4157 domain-containing protein, partial [Acidimicrobiales bacterium]
GGPVPPGADAMTLGRVVMVRRGHEGGRYLLAHELVHVGQYAERGVPRFLAGYLARYLRLRLDGWGHDAAYRRLPEEIEADWQARRSLGWGCPPDQDASG